MPAIPLIDSLARNATARLIALLLTGCLAGGQMAWAQYQQPTDPMSAPATGPMRLRQPSAEPALILRDGTGQGRTAIGTSERPAQTYQGGEFERYVNRLTAPIGVSRFGAELVTPAANVDLPEASPLVPPDYMVQPGDEIALVIWGSVDADLRLQVDRAGRISIPRVGTITVAGTRYADLPNVIRSRVAQVFKNFELSVAMGQLRGIRVYLTGFVTRPGAYIANSLSTLVNVLVKAGGPSAAGSFRAIQLRRNSQVISEFDFYDLLLKGDRSADKVLQPEDVIHIGPVGTQVALIGSVNRPGIFELKPGETASDVVRMAAGFSAVADRTRLAVERLDERQAVRVQQLNLPADATARLGNGDVLRAFSSVEAALSTQRQTKRVIVEGEVAAPGEYLLPAASSVGDALRAAGGLTPAAYIYGTVFTREGVRQTQQENYERALRELETDMSRNALTARTSTADEAAGQTARTSAIARLLDRLRAVKPSGRIVLELRPDSRDLPDLALEDGDRITVPPKSTTVGVFGSVFNAGSYLYSGGRELDDYLRLAGGPTKGADPGSAMVIRANGSVVSARQRATSWFFSGSLAGMVAEAGDTVFVPEEVDKVFFVQGLKDWTQILYNFGIGAAGIKAAFR